MHSKLLLALGSAAWLMTANLAAAEGTGSDVQKPSEGKPAEASTSDETAMPTEVSNGVEFRRKGNARDDNGRTGRSDRSTADRSGADRSNSSDGGEGGGGGAVD